MQTVSTKRYLVVALMLVLTLGLAGLSWAGHWGMGDCWGMDGFGMGPGKKGGRGLARMQMTPEQAGKVFDLHHKFMNETADLRRQMLIKRAELAELWRAQTPDQAKIAAKQKELNALRDQLQEKSLPYRVEMRQVCPMMEQMWGDPAGPKGPPPGGAPKK